MNTCMSNVNVQTKVANLVLLILQECMIYDKNALRCRLIILSNKKIIDKKTSFRGNYRVTKQARNMKFDMDTHA